MWRYRLRIVLLSLGVAFGYGSAYSHFSRAHGRAHVHAYDRDCDPFSWLEQQPHKPEPHEAPAKNVH
jgi:hypothetical protein